MAEQIVEEWRPVAGFESAYEVSSLGRIKSLQRTVLRGNGEMSIARRILAQDANSQGYMRVDLVLRGVRCRRFVHHFVFEAFVGPQTGFTIDHIDCDHLNNRFDNLRPATAEQNCWNSRISKRNTSGFKGVSFCAPLAKWHAQLHRKGLNKHLGYFESKEEAHAAYRKAAEQSSGEFARLA